MSDLSKTLADRQKTHGDFQQVAKVAESLMNNIEFQRLSASQSFAVRMIVGKLARIVCGNPNEPDHWHDIAGYAALVENELNNHRIKSMTYQDYKRDLISIIGSSSTKIVDCKPHSDWDVRLLIDVDFLDSGSDWIEDYVNFAADILYLKHPYEKPTFYCQSYKEILNKDGEREIVHKDGVNGDYVWVEVELVYCK